MTSTFSRLSEPSYQAHNRKSTPAGGVDALRFGRNWRRRSQFLQSCLDECVSCRELSPGSELVTVTPPPATAEKEVTGKADLAY